MRTTVLFSAITFLFCFSLSAQSISPGLHAVGYYQKYAAAGFAMKTIDHQTLNIEDTKIFASAPNDNIYCFTAFASCLDNKNKRFFCCVPRSNYGVLLYTVDLYTSDSINAIPFPDIPLQNVISRRLNMVYDTKTDKILMVNNLSVDSPELISIDPDNGEVETILQLPAGNYEIVRDSYNPVEDKIYLSQPVGTICQCLPMSYMNLLSINLDTKEVEIKPMQAAGYDFGFAELGYNCVDGYIYGVDALYSSTNTSQGSFRVTRIDPSTGEKIYLTDVTDGYVFSPDVAIDPIVNRIFFSESPDGSLGGYIDYFDFNSQSLGSMAYNEVDNIKAYHMYLPLDADASFNSTGTCEHTATNFEGSDDALFWSWDFGDPGSGNENTSSMQQPSHIFSGPGTYTVKLTASTCYSSAVQTKEVTIEPSPKLDLGNDFSMCSNLINEPVSLTAQEFSGASYQWQDNSSSSSFNVSGPGIYWVDVSASCGKVSDTVNVTSEICMCDIALYPDLTMSKISVSIPCELGNFPYMQMQIYNLLGQIVYDQPVMENNFDVSMNSVAAATYLYVFREGNSIVKRGKIEFIR